MTLDQARAAAKLARIEYEPLPCILSIEEAIAQESFVSPPALMVRGEVEPALTAAPHRLSGELRCGGQDHFYLEGQIALATPGEAGEMHLWSSTQHPTEVQHGVAHLLGLPFQRGHRRSAAHGRRLRRQGEPGNHHRRDCGRARLEGAAAGEAAPAA